MSISSASCAFKPATARLPADACFRPRDLGERGQRLLDRLLSPGRSGLVGALFPVVLAQKEHQGIEDALRSPEWSPSLRSG
jgi:hypothetical protein